MCDRATSRSNLNYGALTAIAKCRNNAADGLLIVQEILTFIETSAFRYRAISERTL